MSQDTNSVFAVSGKSLEGLDEKALLALSAECQKNILLSEVSLARAYWDWGPILVELKKLHKGDWTEWKQKNLPGRKADKALSIHKRYETPDLLGDMTVDEALYTQHLFSVNDGETYILNNGSVGYYDSHFDKPSYTRHQYVFDGKAITVGDLTADDVRCVSSKKIGPPTDAELKAAFPPPQTKTKGKSQTKSEKAKAKAAESAKPVQKSWVIRGGLHKGKTVEAIPETGEKTFATEAEAFAAVAKKVKCDPGQRYSVPVHSDYNIVDRPLPAKENLTFPQAIQKAAQGVAQRFVKWADELENLQAQLELLRIGAEEGPDAYFANKNQIGEQEPPTGFDAILKDLIARCDELAEPKPPTIRVVGNAPASPAADSNSGQSHRAVEAVG